MTLLDLMHKYQTDKAEHRFDIPYGFFFDEERRGQVRSVLELGTKKGASLRVWEEYFPNASIFGVEMKSKYAVYASDRSRIFIGSQSDPEVLELLVAAAGSSFDLIIDDGSHMSDDQVASLTYLWRYLKPPYGIYAIEDLHAHARFPEAYSNERCRYPPMSDMLLRHIEGRIAAEARQGGAPGICVYGAVALLLKGEEGPPLDFDRFLKTS